MLSYSGVMIPFDEGANMIRTQIQLTEEQVARLREMAHIRNESVASLIREALNTFLAGNASDRGALFRHALTVVGKYKTEVDDISLDHDRYLEEDFRS